MIQLRGRPPAIGFVVMLALTSLSVAAATLAPSVPGAFAASRPNQRELKARKLYAAGQYQQALDLFAQLYAETLHPVYLRNIGRCHQRLREPEKAIDAFRDYLAKGKDIGADERREVEGFITDMQALQTEQRRAVIADAPAPRVPTPEPAVSLQAPLVPMAPVVAAETSAAPSSRDEVPRFYARPWFWVAVGAVAAGAIAALVLIKPGSGDPACPAEAMGNCR